VSCWRGLDAVVGGSLVLLSLVVCGTWHPTPEHRSEWEHDTNSLQAVVAAMELSWNIPASAECKDRKQNESTLILWSSGLWQYNLVSRYWCLRGIYHLHLQSLYTATVTKLRGIITQTTTTRILIAMKTYQMLKRTELLNRLIHLLFSRCPLPNREHFMKQLSHLIRTVTLQRFGIRCHLKIEFHGFQNPTSKQNKPYEINRLASKNVMH
jgi:hypothetical protein